MTQDRDIVVIGCGAGGGTASQFARKIDRKSTITIFEKNKYPQYSKCGLPFVVSGVISDFKNLIEFNEEWFKKANIDLILEANVNKIDIKKEMIYAKQNDITIEKSFKKLIICTGAKSFIPPIENINIKGVFTVRTIDDTKKILAYSKNLKKATIIGAGLIGLEIADNLRQNGLQVTIVETLQNILANNLDEDMSKIVLEKIPCDISIYTNHTAKKVEQKDGKITKVIIKNKENNEEKYIETDILIIATGTKPDTMLARSIGCKIGITGGILVNEKSETTVKDVYAVGDCTEYIDYVTKKPLLAGLGSVAVRQGIAAGVNSAGGEYNLPMGFLNTNTSKFFNLDIAAVGPISIRIDNEFSVISARYNGSSLPDYYPGGKPISIKVLVDEYTGIIMGAQAVGENAAQRINTIACAILARLDIDTYRKLETAYAPPIAPTLDAETLVCDIAFMKIAQKKR
ncbi:MAG: FAD-dependent oxidoreductase [Thermoplasmatales archaeon]|nr:MAG: FAD-dependent oxidoreductase [Thermoplasmatales archaeon]